MAIQMITAQEVNGTHVLRIQAPVLDATNIVEIKKGFEEAVKEPGGAVSIDLETVKFIDSAGVGALLGFNKYNQAKITLINADPAVVDVLKLLRLQKMFVLEPAEGS